MFGNQFPNNTLGQSSFNPKAKRVENAPDTDSRQINFTSSATSIAPNLMHDHTRMVFTSAPGDSKSVSFLTPTNTEDRGLHWITLNNANNGQSKTFTFSSDYVFLDDPLNTTNSYTVSPNKAQVWFGVFYNNKMQLRVAAESTN